MSVQDAKNTKVLQDSKAGDWVYHIFTGWEIIKERRKKSILIKTTFYNLDGRPFANSANPAIYIHNPFNPEEQPPFESEFKEGEVVAVRDSENFPWTYRLFFSQTSPKSVGCKAELSTEGSVCSWKYARKLTPAERGEGQK